MSEIPISIARREWRRVAQQAAAAPLVLTRHGRPVARLRPVTGTQVRWLDTAGIGYWTATSRSAALGLCALVARCPSLGPILITRRNGASILMLPVAMYTKFAP